MAGSLDPQALQQLTVLRRKEVQRQRLGDYEEAVITLKTKVKDAEGQAMRETVQDKVCTSLTQCYPAACTSAWGNAMQHVSVLKAYVYMVVAPWHGAGM